MRNRITRCLVCSMVISLATAAQESHDFNRGRCQDRVMDETEAQMPDEEFEHFWEKYI